MSNSYIKDCIDETQHVCQAGNNTNIIIIVNNDSNQSSVKSTGLQNIIDNATAGRVQDASQVSIVQVPELFPQIIPEETGLATSSVPVNFNLDEFPSISIEGASQNVHSGYTELQLDDDAVRKLEKVLETEEARQIFGVPLLDITASPANETDCTVSTFPDSTTSDDVPEASYQQVEEQQLSVHSRRSVPERRSQRQVDKAEREEVRKIRAENQLMFKKEREQLLAQQMGKLVENLEISTPLKKKRGPPKNLQKGKVVGVKTGVRNLTVKSKRKFLKKTKETKTIESDDVSLSTNTEIPDIEMKKLSIRIKKLDTDMINSEINYKPLDILDPSSIISIHHGTKASDTSFLSEQISPTSESHVDSRQHSKNISIKQNLENSKALSDSKVSSSCEAVTGGENNINNFSGEKIMGSETKVISEAKLLGPKSKMKTNSKAKVMGPESKMKTVSKFNLMGPKSKVKKVSKDILMGSKIISDTRRVKHEIQDGETLAAFQRHHEKIPENKRNLSKLDRKIKDQLFKSKLKKSANKLFLLGKKLSEKKNLPSTCDISMQKGLATESRLSFGNDVDKSSIVGPSRSVEKQSKPKFESILSSADTIPVKIVKYISPNVSKTLTSLKIPNTPQNTKVLLQNSNNLKKFKGKKYSDIDLFPKPDPKNLIKLGVKPKSNPIKFDFSSDFEGFGVEDTKPNKKLGLNLLDAGKDDLNVNYVGSERSKTLFHKSLKPLSRQESNSKNSFSKTLSSPINTKHSEKIKTSTTGTCVEEKKTSVEDGNNTTLHDIFRHLKNSEQCNKQISSNVFKNNSCDIKVKLSENIHEQKVSEISRKTGIKSFTSTPELTKKLITSKSTRYNTSKNSSVDRQGASKSFDIDRKDDDLFTQLSEQKILVPESFLATTLKFQSPTPFMSTQTKTDVGISPVHVTESKTDLHITHADKDIPKAVVGISPVDTVAENNLNENRSTDPNSAGSQDLNNLKCVINAISANTNNINHRENSLDKHMSLERSIDNGVVGLGSVRMLPDNVGEKQNLSGKTNSKGTEVFIPIPASSDSNSLTLNSNVPTNSLSLLQELGNIEIKNKQYLNNPKIKLKKKISFSKDTKFPDEKAVYVIGLNNNCNSTDSNKKFNTSSKELGEENSLLKPHKEALNKRSELNLSDEMSASQRKRKNSKAEETSESENDQTEEHSEEKSSEDDSENEEDDPDKLWCICRKPHNNRFMICCDKCEDWFHGTCVGITRAMGEQMEESEEQWKCPQCKKAEKAAQKEVKAQEKGTPKRNNSVPQKEKSSTGKKEKTEPRVLVFEKSTGFLLSGVHAPTLSILSEWLEENTDYTILEPAMMNSIFNDPVTGQKRINLEEFGIQPTKPKKSSHSSSSTPTSVKKAKKTKLLNSSEIKELEEKRKTPSKVSSVFYRNESSKRNSVDATDDYVPTKKPPKEPKPPKTPKIAEPPSNPVPKPDIINVRMNVRKVIYDALTKRREETNKEFDYLDEVEMRSLCQEIEEQLFQTFGRDVGFKYKSRYRSLVFNIKDSKNSGLFRKILGRNISPKRLATMTSEELASKELAEWREREEKKEIEAIEKHELDLMSLGNRYIMKSHKGEIAIDNDFSAKNKADTESMISLTTKTADSTIRSKSEIEEEEALINHKNHIYDPDCRVCMRYQVSADESTIKTEESSDNDLEKRKKESKSHHRRESDSHHRRESDSHHRKGSDSHHRSSSSHHKKDRHHSHSHHKNKKDKRSRSSSKDRKSKDHKKERSKSREKEKKRHTSESKDRKDKTDKKRERSSSTDRKHRKRERSSSEIKSVTSESRSVTSQDHATPVDQVTSQDHQKETEQRKEKVRRESEASSQKNETKGDESGEENDDTFDETAAHDQIDIEIDATSDIENSLPLPLPILTDVPNEEDQEEVEDSISSPETPKIPIVEDDVLLSPATPPMPEERMTPPPKSTAPNIPMPIWKGRIQMPEVAKFMTAAFEVSGKALFFSDDVPVTVDVVGRINPDNVWPYIGQIKKAGTKDIIVTRFQPSSEEEKVSYIALYSYLSSKRRYGVIGGCEKTVKDFYIIPLASHQPIPQVLLPLDGPGFEEKRPHMLIGVIIRARNRKIYDPITETWSVVGEIPQHVESKPRPSRSVSNEKRHSNTSPIQHKSNAELDLEDALESDPERSSPIRKHKHSRRSSKAHKKTSKTPSPDTDTGDSNEPQTDTRTSKDSMLAELNRQVERDKLELSEMQKTADKLEVENESKSQVLIDNQDNSSNKEEDQNGESEPVSALDKIDIPSNLLDILNNIKDKEQVIKEKEYEIKRRIESESLGETKDVDLRVLLNPQDEDLRQLPVPDVQKKMSVPDTTKDEDLRSRDPRSRDPRSRKIDERETEKISTAASDANAMPQVDGMQSIPFGTFPVNQMPMQQVRHQPVLPGVVMNTGLMPGIPPNYRGPMGPNFGPPPMGANFGIPVGMPPFIRPPFAPHNMPGVLGRLPFMRAPSGNPNFGNHPNERKRGFDWQKNSPKDEFQNKDRKRLKNRKKANKNEQETSNMNNEDSDSSIDISDM